jgi:glutathione S-transferase
MNHSPFAESTLYISARSPFARRVRLAFIENQIPYEEQVRDVFKPTPDFIAVNPLARVPALVLKSGEILIDSHFILGTFYELHKSALLSTNLKDQLLTRHWSGIAVGLCEKSVEYYLENLRPEEKRDTETLDEISAIFGRVLPLFDAFIANREFIGSKMTQADLDMGTALTYLSLRYSPQWTQNLSHAASYLARMESRPSFQKTVPSH